MGDSAVLRGKFPMDGKEIGLIEGPHMVVKVTPFDRAIHAGLGGLGVFCGGIRLIANRWAVLLEDQDRRVGGPASEDLKVAEVLHFGDGFVPSQPRPNDLAIVGFKESVLNDVP